MKSSRLWAVLSALMLCALVWLSACGGATGLLGGNQSAAGGTAGVAGTPGRAGSSGNGGSAGQGIGEAGFGAISEGGEAGSSEPSATLVSLAITPTIASAAVGTRVLLRAIGTYSDNSTKDVTGNATWSSASPALASVSAGVVSALAPGMVTISASLEGKSGSAVVTVPSATVESLTVTPATSTTGIQGTVSFQAVVTLSDATTQDVTATATWTSSNTAVASMGSAGIATGISAGNSVIRATAGGVTGQAQLTVTRATLVSIAVTPTNPTLGIGVTQVFTATGSFSDGSIADVSANATFSSSASAVASMDASTHSAKTLSAGTSTISAAVGAITGSTTLTVTAATLDSISVTPATNTLAVGASTTLTATGSYSDGTSADLTASVTWQSSNTAVATVSNASGSTGDVTGLSGGTASVSATLGNVSGSAAVTVTSAALVSLAIAPENPTLPRGMTQALVATGTYSDGSTVDLTGTVTWSSDATTVATVSNATSNAGTVSAIAIGTSTVHATLGGVSTATTVTVTAAKLTSIAVTPANPSLPAGTSQTLTATASYSDQTTVDVTTTAVWTSSAASTASVSNASGSQGEVTAITRGTATITATLSGVAGSTTVTVTAPTLKQVVLSPIAGSVKVGSTVRYTATAIYSNNTQAQLNQGVTWSSADSGIATIATGGGMGFGGAVATGVSAGTTTITATYQGVTGSTTLTVTSATVSSIEVTPINPTLSVGGRQQFTATAIYSDATTQDVTARATWVSSDTTVAQVSTAGGGPGGGGQRGTVTALAAGTTTISATLNGFSGSSTVTVTTATLSSIQVTPSEPSIAAGVQLSFVATAIYSDNTTQNVTGRATWISSTPSVASISTANGSRGQALAIAAGGTTISATVDGVTGTTTLTVTSAKLVSLQITPFSPTIPLGFDTNLIATGIYSDNTTRDLTALVTWSSNAANVASVSDAAGSRGLLTPISAGGATISASYQGVIGSDAVTISAATLKTIAVTPATASIALHVTQAFTAVGTLSDGTTLDVTSYVTWLSTTPSIASISNAAGSRGFATALALGTVTISAVRGTTTGTASLTVQ